MDQPEFEKIQATFPWTERTVATARGGVVQLIDCNGNEVPIFTMTSFLEMITQKLAKKTEPKTDNKEAA